MKKKSLVGWVSGDFKPFFKFRKQDYFSSRRIYIFHKVMIPCIVKDIDCFTQKIRNRKHKVRITIEEIK